MAIRVENVLIHNNFCVGGDTDQKIKSTIVN